MLMTSWIRPPIVEILLIVLFLLPKPCEVHDVENLPEETSKKHAILHKTLFLIFGIKVKPTQTTTSIR